jgi:hypothetical protein
MYKLSFFVPLDAAELVKDRLFSIGVGRIGHYDCCCWQTKGQGQFRPLDGSNPHVGQKDKIEYIDELKIEMVCQDDLISEAIRVLKESHPYEEVAYEYFKVNGSL